MIDDEVILELLVSTSKFNINPLSSMERESEPSVLGGARSLYVQDGTIA